MKNWIKCIAFSLAMVSAHNAQAGVLVRVTAETLGNLAKEMGIFFKAGDNAIFAATIKRSFGDRQTAEVVKNMTSQMAKQFDEGGSLASLNTKSVDQLTEDDWAKIHATAMQILQEEGESVVPCTSSSAGVSIKALRKSIFTVDPSDLSPAARSLGKLPQSMDEAGILLKGLDKTLTDEQLLGPKYNTLNKRNRMWTFLSIERNSKSADTREFMGALKKFADDDGEALELGFREIPAEMKKALTTDMATVAEKKNLRPCQALAGTF